MKKKILTAVGAVVLLFLLFNLKDTLGFFGNIFSAVYPVFIGVVVALTLNAPVKLMEKRVFVSKKIPAKFKRILSVVTVLTVFVGTLVGIGFLLAPDVKKSIDYLIEKLPDIDWADLFSFLGEGRLKDMLGKLLNDFTEKLSALLPEAMDAITKTALGVLNALLGLVFGVMIVIHKESLATLLSRIIGKFTDSTKTAKIMAGVAGAAEKFSRFLAGQLLEAVIFGIICYVTFILFKIPYAALAAIVMALGNLIPMLGAYVGGAIAFVIIFSASANKAVVFVIIIVILQQLEQITTYPLVVGKNVGLSSFWVLFAVIVGGNLFGFWGLILGVPIIAFADNLFKALSRSEPPENLQKEIPTQ